MTGILENYGHDVLVVDGDVRLVQFTVLPPETLDFLREINWGSDGAVYVNQDMEWVFNSIPKPHLVAAFMGDALRITGVFCHSEVRVGGKSYPSFYVRFFAASPVIKGQGITRKYTPMMMEAMRKGIEHKTIYFANVELANRSSYKVVTSAGYRHMFTFMTHGFSRFFPRRHARVELVSEGGKQQVRALLEQQYAEHALVQFDLLFHTNNYHVIRKDGEIVAGCQYFRIHWVVKNMKGRVGKVILKVMPHVPLVRRLFNPRRFEFLAFDALYCKPGHERDLAVLFEHLLAIEKLNSAMFWMGKNCPVRARVLSRIHLGLIHKFVQNNAVACNVAPHQFSQDEIEDMASRPVYAPAFDFI